MRSFIYRTHIWLGLIIAVPVLAWASSGLLYAWPNAVEGGKIESIASGRVQITPALALQRSDEFAGRKLPVTALTLLMREGRPVYQAVGGMGADSLLVDAETGQVMKAPPPGLLTLYFRQAHFYFFCRELAGSVAHPYISLGLFVSFIGYLFKRHCLAREVPENGPPLTPARIGLDMLEALNVSINYGARQAVVDVSLRLSPGDITALVGANGAGKSSLLRALNGGLHIDAGEVLLDGKTLQGFPRRLIGRRIAVVGQETDVRFPVTVLEFILGGRYAWASNAGWGWETLHDVEVARGVLQETQLGELHDRLLSELSGGERQRAVLARALATEAGVLLLDEPTANLDLAHQASILALVRQRCDSLGTSALVITHDINLAAEFADRVLLMKDGKRVAFGTPDEVLTAELLKEVFAVRVLVDAHPITGVPRITPVHEALR